LKCGFVRKNKVSKDEDFSLKEIAEITGKSALSVRVTLHRALKKLEEFLPKIEVSKK
jgi:DNA-directed RNA polymerase specialized sigma24 family protein